MTPVADAIRAMQDRLGRPEWWCKGANHDGQAACLRGAQFDTSDGEVMHQVARILNDAVEGWTGNSLASVTTFNDLRSTTHADILLFLDAALDIAEAEGL